LRRGYAIGNIHPKVRNVNCHGLRCRQPRGGPMAGAKVAVTLNRAMPIGCIRVIGRRRLPICPFTDFTFLH
jgi:hypothetical protein